MNKKLLIIVLMTIMTAVAVYAQNDTLFTRTELYHPGDYGQRGIKVLRRK